jgi:release factor glutamine methyltransferase
MYAPEEDSFFLSEVIFDFMNSLNEKKILKNKSFLDMGCSSCIQALTANKILDKCNIFCVDIEKEAINQAKKLKFKTIKSDLFSNLKKDKKFDFISFNAPYLPEHELDKEKDTSGGKKGDEIVLRFLKQTKKHLNRGGTIFLLVSSITPLRKIKQEIKKQGFQVLAIKQKNIFFEKLYVLVIQSLKGRT